MMNKNIFLKADDMSRRSFAKRLAAGCLGVSAASMLTQEATAAPISLRKGAPAKAVIYLYMSGGMSHLDSFDPKSGSEFMGNSKAIATSADGVKVSNYFPNMAKQMKHVVAINSMTTTQGAHVQGSYFMHSSYTPRGTIIHPHMGSWVNMMAGNVHGTLPANVVIGNNGNTLGSGWLPGKYAAMPISNAAKGIKYSARHRTVEQKEFDRRVATLKKMNSEFQHTYKSKDILEHNEIYKDAIKLMSSKDLDAFDISKESEKDRAAYPDSNFGNGCLLARRLVQNGVRYVEVKLGDWDMHNAVADRMKSNAQVLDEAMAALIKDLDRKGMLDTTMVVLATEFGRSPKINVNSGRDHFPRAFSCLLAGGGVKGGQSYGKTDKDGMNVLENKVKPSKLNATIAHALGLPIDKVYHSPNGRPFKVADKGKPILEIF